MSKIYFSNNNNLLIENINNVDYLRFEGREDLFANFDFYEGSLIDTVKGISSTPSGTVQIITTTDNKGGYCLNSTTNGFLTIDNTLFNNVLQTWSGLTISAWFKINTVNTSGPFYIGDSYYAGYYGSWNYIALFNSSSSSSIGVSCLNSTNPWTTADGANYTSIASDTYKNVVVTFDNTTLKYYIDGYLVSQKTIENTDNKIENISTNYIKLFESNYTGDPEMIGNFYKFSIYSSSLTDTDIYNTYVKELNEIFTIFKP